MQPHNCFPHGVFLCFDLASGQNKHRILYTPIGQAGRLSVLLLCICGVSVAGFSQGLRDSFYPKWSSPEEADMPH